MSMRNKVGDYGYRTAYGLYSPTSGIDYDVIGMTKGEVKAKAKCTYYAAWEWLAAQGFDVVPITILYEPPKT